MSESEVNPGASPLAVTEIQEDRQQQTTTDPSAAIGMGEMVVQDEELEVSDESSQHTQTRVDTEGTDGTSAHQDSDSLREQPSEEYKQESDRLAEKHGADEHDRIQEQAQKVDNKREGEKGEDTSSQDEYSELSVDELEALALKLESEFAQEDAKRERLQTEIAELQVVLQSESQALYEDAERRRHEAEAASALAIKNYAATEEAMKSVQLQETYLRDLVAKMKTRKSNSSLWSNFVRNISPGNDKAKVEKAAAAEKAAKDLTARRTKSAGNPTTDTPLIINGRERWGDVQELLLCHNKGIECLRTTPLYVRMLTEDIRPCLESYSMDTDYLVDQLWGNTLQIQPAPLHEQKEDVCSLSSIKLLCSHRLRATGDKAKAEHHNWCPLGSPCYSRVTAVGDLIAYLRYIGMGINNSSAGVIFQDIVSKLLHISAARLGIQSTHNHRAST